MKLLHDFKQFITVSLRGWTITSDNNPQGSPNLNNNLKRLRSQKMFLPEIWKPRHEICEISRVMFFWHIFCFLFKKTDSVFFCFLKFAPLASSPSQPCFIFHKYVYGCFEFIRLYAIYIYIHSVWSVEMWIGHFENHMFLYLLYTLSYYTPNTWTFIVLTNLPPLQWQGLHLNWFHSSCCKESFQTRLS